MLPQGDNASRAVNLFAIARPPRFGISGAQFGSGRARRAARVEIDIEHAGSTAILEFAGITFAHIEPRGSELSIKLRWRCADHAFQSGHR